MFSANSTVSHQDRRKNSDAPVSKKPGHRS